MIALVFDDDYSMYYCTLCRRPFQELHRATEHEKYCGEDVPMPTPEHEAMSRASSLIKLAKLTDKQRKERVEKYFPQRKPWVGLTDAEIHRTTVLMGFNPEWKTEIGMVHAIVRNLEATLKKKNT